MITGQPSDGNPLEQERLDTWRSETLTALTALPEYKTNLVEASDKICNRLNDMLSPWLREAGPFAKVEERFRHEILDPTIKLHQDLQSSSHPYMMIPIKAFDGFSSKQMLNDWHLKDADTWQKVRGEKEVGRALYCLHPKVMRLRAKDTIPIVIAKPVIVVESPERTRALDPRGIKHSGIRGPLPSAIEYSLSPTTDHFTSSITHGRVIPQGVFGPEPSLFDDSDSDSTTHPSGRPRLSVHRRKASTYPVTKRHNDDHQSEPPPQRRLTVPLDSSSPHRDEDHHR